MKKTNKGFSMVELIIVIAIMAILAGALAPALIKYINKSRLSTDIQTANTISTAVQTALATENGYDAAATTWSGSHSLSAIWAGTDSCAAEIKSTCGGTSSPKLKAKKCNDKNCTKAGYGGAGADFVVKIDAANNEVIITESKGGHQLFPTADSCIKD